MGHVLAVLYGLGMGLLFSFSTANQETLDTVSSQCKMNGGLEKAIFQNLGPVEITCKDGARFKLKEKE